jgi:hypothetical protein
LLAIWVFGNPTPPPPPPGATALLPTGHFAITQRLGASRTRPVFIINLMLGPPRCAARAIFFILSAPHANHVAPLIRLYQAPVESDIQSKAAAEKGPAQSRTSIRRIRSARVPDRAREHRRRVLAAAAASYNGFDPRRGSTALDPPMRSPPAADSSSHGLTPGSDQGYRALRDVAGRMGILDDRVVAMFGERWAHLHAESNPSPRRDDSNEPSPLLGMAVESEFLPRSRPPPEPYAYTLSNIRSTQAPNHPVCASWFMFQSIFACRVLL